jgi:hypothetical protein
MHAHGLFRPADVYDRNTLSRIGQSKRCCTPFKPEMATNFTRNTSAGFINRDMEEPELEDPELNGPQVSPTRDIDPRAEELEQATTATTATISQLPPVELNGKRSGNIFSCTRIYRSARLREDQRVSIGNLWLKRSACGRHVCRKVSVYPYTIARNRHAVHPIPLPRRENTHLLRCVLSGFTNNQC